MTKIYDDMRVTVNDKVSGWICHIRYIERHQEKIDAPNHSGDIVFRYETEKETCNRLDGVLEFGRNGVCPKPGSTATIRNMTFYYTEIPRPLPAWLEFHKRHPDFEKWKTGFYAREGETYLGEVGIYTNSQEPPEDGRRKFQMWILEFDGLDTTPEDGQAGCASDGLLPDYLEEIAND